MGAFGSHPLKCGVGLAVACGALSLGPRVAHAGTLTVKLKSCEPLVFTPGSTAFTDTCQNSDGGFGLTATPSATAVSNGQTGGFTVTPPAGFTIEQATASGLSVGAGIGAPGSAEWQAGLSAGGAPTYVNTGDTSAGTGANLNAGALSFSLTCQQTSCPDATSVGAREIDLTANETQNPVITTNPLYHAYGGTLLSVPPGKWVSGSWGLDWSATSPSGVCSVYAQVDTEGEPLFQDPQHDGPTPWQQCPDPSGEASVDTTVVIPTSGSFTYTLTAVDAAGNQTQVSNTVLVDNTKPKASFAKPQISGDSARIRVAASAPSGIEGIECQVNGTQFSVSPGDGSVYVSTGSTQRVSCDVTSNTETAIASLQSSQIASTYDLPRTVSERTHPLTTAWAYTSSGTELTGLKAAIRFPRGTRTAITCTGRGCPKLAKVQSTSLAAALKRVKGKGFAPGDKVTVTLSAKGHRAIRVTATISAGHAPRLTTA